jgi:ComF family protein
MCQSDCIPFYSFGEYKEPLKNIIIELKFRGVTGPATEISEMLTGHFADLIVRLRADMLVPIPLYPTRQYRRGYNQAELFAEKLSMRLELPVEAGLIIRRHRRRPQANLTEQERRKNIKGVFEVVKHSDSGERVLLVDDVITSGLTMIEAVKELSHSGYKVVGALSIAHGV